MRRIALAGAAVMAGLAVAASTMGFGPGPGRDAAATPEVAGAQLAPVSASQLRHSVAGAYAFLNSMMDRYAAGSVASTSPGPSRGFGA